MPRTQPLALLFDLGEVVIDIDLDRALKTWQPRSQLSIDQLREAFKFDSHYESHERGEVSTEQYYDHLAGVLKIEPDPVHIAHGWNSIYVGEIAETVASDLLENVQGALGAGFQAVHVSSPLDVRRALLPFGHAL